MPNDSITFEGYTFYFSQGYYKRPGKRGPRFLHRWVWECTHGPIPDGFVVHHKDHDTRNNGIDNLEIMPTDIHAKYHGAAQSAEQRRRLAEAGAAWHREPANRRRMSAATKQHWRDGVYDGNDNSAFYAGRDKWVKSDECREINRDAAIQRHKDGILKPPGDEALKRAAEWHRSEEGRAWHREHGKATWSGRERHPCVCQYCGKSFHSHWPTRAKYCGINCKRLAYKARGVG